ncbi:MAG: hypothetical protein J7L94_12250 [Caldisericaceae bacterium]|nr:hypothetical protein [Caldisericaceae bacterium]
MKHDKDFLINRLIHKAKNDLATLKLAATNLKFILNETDLPLEQNEQADDFLQVIQTQINESIRSLRRALLLTSNSEQNLKFVNLVQILLELTDKRPQFKLKNNSLNFVVHSEPQLLKWFFESFFNISGVPNSAEIELKPETKQVRVRFDSEATVETIFSLLNSDNAEDSLEILTIKQLSTYLGIKFSRPNFDRYEPLLILDFNQ